MIDIMTVLLALVSISKFYVVYYTMSCDTAGYIECLCVYYVAFLAIISPRFIRCSSHIHSLHDAPQECGYPLNPIQYFFLKILDQLLGNYIPDDNSTKLDKCRSD